MSQKHLQGEKFRQFAVRADINEACVIIHLLYKPCCPHGLTLKGSDMSGQGETLFPLDGIKMHADGVR